MEAIEVDVFRQRYEHDTFWCGTLLGGCGSQVTTKLYTDRVCHFAHHPAADGTAHCGRNARGVASADHLYVKAAASAWLRGSGYQEDLVRFDFARPRGADIGSVVDIAFRERGLRVHLDQSVEPVWDEEGHEPVLGVSVPVDRDTLIRRWYVHRISLDSEGTSRRVRIGTEAFARPTQWFALEECAMTGRGLSTPAVEEIVRSRTTRPTAPWAGGRADATAAAPARALSLLRRLADARKVGSTVVVGRLCDELDALVVEKPDDGRLSGVVEDARSWLGGQADVRRKLFADLEEAVALERVRRIRQLLVQANATASHDRTEEESRIVGRAAAHLAACGADLLVLDAKQKHALRARASAKQARKYLQRLAGFGRLERRSPGPGTRKIVERMAFCAANAGDLLKSNEIQRITEWKVRAGLATQGEAELAERPEQPSSGAPEEKPRAKQPPTQGQVARRFWLQEPCPRCFAVVGKDCYNDDRTGKKRARAQPHPERLRPILARRASARRPQRGPLPRGTQAVLSVNCPDCGSAPGQPCRSPRGSHRGRVERAAGVR
ncbi:zinc finger domain-containing protein [Streptomyces xanthophaeus]